MMVAGSTTVDRISCELCEAMISTNISATSASKPRGITAENHNLIPPFILDQAELVEDANPRNHSKYLTVENHSIF